MRAFLSQEWLDLQRSLAEALPRRPEVSARLQVVVTGGPDGEVRYAQTIEDGRLTASHLGVDDTAELTLTLVWADAERIARGELPLEVGFMQGRVKLEGDVGALLAVQPLLQSSEYCDLLAAVAAQSGL